MSKSRAPIPLHNPKDLLRRVSKLIEQRRFAKALPLARQLREEEPDNPFAWAAEGICLSESGKKSDALKVFDRALKRFPNDSNLQYYKAETLSEQGKHHQAEQVYRMALSRTTPGDDRGRSQCLNGLGVVLWHQGMKEQALDCWKEATAADPSNRIARRNLETFTNQYGRPASVSPAMDDVNHFRDLKIKEYLERQGRDEFISKAEVEQVIAAIFQAWNAELAPRGHSLDTMTPAEKSSLFASIPIVYPSSSEASVPPKEHIGSIEDEVPEGEEDVEEVVDEVAERIQKTFPFLPSAESALLVMTAGIPALKAAGMPHSRLRGLLSGKAATRKDAERITWVWEVLEEVVAAFLRAGTKHEKTSMASALDILCRKLPDDLAGDVLGEMKELVEEVLSEDDDPEEEQ